MTINDVSAETMFDVLHDGQYRKKWDPTMLESFDIARLSANADVGYYSCESSSAPTLGYLNVSDKLFTFLIISHFFKVQIIVL